MDNTKNIIHDLNLSSTNDTMKYSKFFLVLFVVLLLGGLSGFLLSKITDGSAATNKSADAKVEKTAGIADKKTFKDKAEGVLKEGGMEGEGNFHLERPGGESQNVYLTSTTVDLSEYLGKKVKVWGETFQAEKAGWLMDVGLVELL